MFEYIIQNNQMRILKLFFCFMLLLSLNAIKAQETKYNPKEYSNQPMWIEMMDDSSVNYYEALKAYEQYWQNRIRPQEEEDAINEHGSRKAEREREKFEKKLAKMTPAERTVFDRMKYECKRFDNWKREVKKFVQEDGHILSYDQKLEIWNRQQVEMKKLNKSDK
ncbi:MAG: hypothetical protein EBZ58_09205 [Bacteroidetes bacterium]|jgi:hypothetical protein|nr:hypothetical protein [Bacteroidota bacterium]